MPVVTAYGNVIDHVSGISDRFETIKIGIITDMNAGSTTRKTRTHTNAH